MHAAHRSTTSLAGVPRLVPHQHQKAAARRALLQVTACLKCAAQQLIRLPVAGSRSSCGQQDVEVHGDRHAWLQQQQHCLAESLLHRQQAAPQLALAAAGCFSPSSPTTTSSSSNQRTRSIMRSSSGGSDTSSSSSSSSSSAGEVGHAAPPSHPAQPGPQSSGQEQQPLQPQQHVVDGFPDLLAPFEPQQQQQQPTQQAEEEGAGVDSPGVRAALAALRWYKGVLSPSMASTCRFLPTCSQYAMDSYRKYGVAKGTVLTAWRLLRCNPWGPSGYDPTSWPPVGLPAALFSWAYSAEVAVVVGAAVFLRFSHALLFE